MDSETDFKRGDARARTQLKAFEVGLVNGSAKHDKHLVFRMTRKNKGGSAIAVSIRVRLGLPQAVPTLSETMQKTKTAQFVNTCFFCMVFLDFHTTGLTWFILKHTASKILAGSRQRHHLAAIRVPSDC